MKQVIHIVNENDKRPSLLDKIIYERICSWIKDYEISEIVHRIENEKNSLIRFKMRNLFYKQMNKNE